MPLERSCSSPLRRVTAFRVRATRNTCAARWNGKTGYITGTLSLTSAWDIAYEVALDTGGVLWLTEAALMPRRKVR